MGWQWQELGGVLLYESMFEGWLGQARGESIRGSG